jgi:hypothetical protein
MKDNFLHHAEGENPGEVMEKPVRTRLTQSEITELISRHTKAWPPGKGFFGRLRVILWKLLPIKRSRLALISRDNKDDSGFNLSISMEISSQASLHSKLVMLTAKWLMEKFIQSAGSHDPETIMLIESMPFLTGAGRSL